MANQPTFFWHDYETWGATPSRDRASQFAGVRTNMDLEPIEEPVMFYCQPPLDQLPSPEACLITGIAPQQAMQLGLPEYEFVKRVHEQLARPNTCSVGYNSIRFDDEVSRYSFYRNFYDPYAREWQNGNSRWDVLDMLRTAYALRPDSFQWPLNENGDVSFKLENLAKANNLSHEKAHDALSDVYATIAVSKLVKDKEPKLFEHLFKLRKKQEVAKLLNVVNHLPVLNVSGMFSVERSCLAMLMPLMYEPANNNAVLCYDLSQDPTEMLSMTADQIRERLYTKTVDLPAGVKRLGLKSIHINKCPVVLPVSMLNDDLAKRAQLDRELAKKHWQMIDKHSAFLETLGEVFSVKNDRPALDADAALYSGFLNNHDKQTCDLLRESTAEELAAKTFVFQDDRLQKLFFRYRARNFPETLSEQEQWQWRAFCEERLMFAPQGGHTLESYIQEVQSLLISELDPKKQTLLKQLLQWGQQMAGAL